jgi:hypothetical protein
VLTLDHLGHPGLVNRGVLYLVSQGVQLGQAGRNGWVSGSGGLVPGRARGTVNGSGRGPGRRATAAPLANLAWCVSQIGLLPR